MQLALASNIRKETVPSAKRERQMRESVEKLRFSAFTLFLSPRQERS